MLREKPKRKKGNEVLAYTNPFLDIRHTNVDFGSFEKDYYVVEFGPRAGVVVVADEKILLVRQYRFLVDGYSWELPGGKVDAGESLEAAVVRECAEETGVLCKNLEKLVVYYPGLDNVQNRTTVFYTKNFKDHLKFVPDEREVVEIAWISLAECMRMIKDELIMDAMTVSGILAYHCRGAMGTD